MIVFLALKSKSQPGHASENALILFYSCFCFVIYNLLFLHALLLKKYSTWKKLLLFTHKTNIYFLLIFIHLPLLMPSTHWGWEIPESDWTSWETMTRRTEFEAKAPTTALSGLPHAFGFGANSTNCLRGYFIQIFRCLHSCLWDFLVTMQISVS